MDDYIRILVVDDEADIRRIIRILLESRGYRVLEAPNGRLAVETIRKEPDVRSDSARYHDARALRH